MKMKTAKNNIVFSMKVNNSIKLIRRKIFKGFNIMDKSFNKHIKLLSQRHYLIKQLPQSNKKIKTTNKKYLVLEIHYISVQKVQA